jgi:hypothetical protein
VGTVKTLLALDTDRLVSVANSRLIADEVSILR